MSTIPDELGHAGVERVVIWQCCSASEDADLQRWVDRALTAIEVAGGTLAGVVGSSIACAFDTMDLEDAVDLCASLSKEARSDEAWPRVRYGIAIGNVHTGAGRGSLALVHSGSALDRAQLLANHATAGEVVLDHVAHQHSQELFLFSRSLLASGQRGHVLDLQNLRRSHCREAVAQLGEPIVTGDAQTSFEQLRESLAREGPQRVIVRGDSRHHTLDWTRRLAAELGAERCLRMRQQAGGLQPLGGLSASLHDEFPNPQALAAAPLPEAAAQTAADLMAGRAVARKPAADMLAALLSPTDGRSWLVLDRLHDIDAATLGVVAEVAARGQDGVIVLSVPPGTKVPAALTAGGEAHEHALSPLTAAGATELAEALLGAPPRDPIARRVAALGGRTTLGVLEAARTLVSSGDLVRRGKDFMWRSDPRAGGGAIPVDALISERVAGLDHDAFRLLEALTVTSPGGYLELTYGVAERDGLPREAWAPALDKLVEEGFAERDGSLGSAETTVRNAMRNNMPPARVAELHRFCAAALDDARADDPSFLDALLAYHRSEGGLDADAGAALLNAAHATSESGFHRMAVRLAAVAMQFDPSSETRSSAQALARRLSTPTRAPTERTEGGEEPRQTEPPSDSMAERAMRSAVDGIVGGDYETVERWLDTALVAGWDQTATRRLRAITQMSRGDTQAALHTLQIAHQPDVSHAADAREAMSWSLLHMATGDTEEAITAALSALAAARADGDGTGSGAALHLLAACYDSLDRPSEAGRLRAAAES